MEEKQQMTNRVHKINMIGRREAAITGVSDVLSFNPEEAIFETQEGILMIRGEELHIKNINLEKGEVDMEGKINGMNYSDKGMGTKGGESLFGRFFK